jgi:hypothetical protein
MSRKWLNESRRLGRVFAVRRASTMASVVVVGLTIWSGWAAGSGLFADTALPTNDRECSANVGAPGPLMPPRPALSPIPIGAYGPASSLAPISPAALLPFEWKTPLKIGHDYYRLALECQAGRLSEEDRRFFEVRPSDRIEVLVYCETGRTGEVVDLVARDRGGQIAAGESPDRRNTRSHAVRLRGIARCLHGYPRRATDDHRSDPNALSASPPIMTGTSLPRRRVATAQV